MAECTGCQKPITMFAGRKTMLCQPCRNRLVHADPVERAKLQRPMPDDFARVALTMSDHQLRTLFTAGPATIARWRKESGTYRARPLGKPNAKIPSDFAERARGLTVPQACTYYGKDTRTIRRWFAYAGLIPKEVRFKSTRAVQRAELDPSVPAQAAQHLRRYYPSVHRADLPLQHGRKDTWGSEIGLPDYGRGLYYVAGIGVVPDYEMIAVARDHGFRECAA